VTLTLESPHSPGGARPKSRAAWAVAIGAAIILTFVLLSFLNKGPHKISQVTVTNNTPYDLQIDLSGQAKGSTTPLGIVSAMRTTEFPDVIDVGSTWHISVTSQGHDADDLVIPRSQLKSQGWKLVFGADVTAKLHQAGLQPSPTSG
jgi:hypothetical protein